MQRYELSPDPAGNGQLETLLACINDGTREWREYLEEPPIEAIVWQPYPNGPSIGGQILHIASCEVYWLQLFVAGLGVDLSEPDMAYDSTLDQDNHHWPTPPSQPLSWYFEIQDRRRAESVAFIRSHGDPSAVYPRRDCEVTFGWIVAHLVEHDSYHGGQAVLLNEMWKKLRA